MGKNDLKQDESGFVHEV